MDEESNDETFAVWENLLNALTMALFKSLENAADFWDRLLTHISNTSRDLPEVFVPRPGVSKCLDSYYCAFNTWLIGRLFYVGSVKELQRIHVTSKDAQIKILSVLCTNRASFYRAIHSKYFITLLKLFQYYQDYPKSNNLEIILENFTTEEVHIPNVNIDSEPIYVKVNDMSTCKTLINLNLQLISESLPPSLLCYRTGLEENLFDKIIHAVENYSIDIKLVGLRFFLNIITNMEKVSAYEFQMDFSRNYENLLYCIKSLLQASNALYDKGEIDNTSLVDFNAVHLELLKLIRNNLKIEHEKDFAEICMVILNKTSNSIFNKELKLLCLSMTKSLKLNDNILNITEMDYSEINNVSDYYCHKIMESIHNRSEVNKSDLCKVFYYNKVISVIMSTIKSCEELNIDTLLLNHHLHRCVRALTILERINLEFYNKETCISLISIEEVENIWKVLTKIIKQKKMIITNNDASINLILDIAVSTVSLQNIFDINILLQLVCLQDSVTFTEHHLSFSNAVKLKILKYLLIIKLVMKSAVNGKWNTMITHLYSSLMSRKDIALLKQIVQIGPLLVINKEISASKLIGDILMPVFMSKEETAQTNVFRILPVIACVSLGTCNIIKTISNTEGQEILDNVNLRVVCNKCNNEIENKSKVFQTVTESLQPTNTSLNGLKSLFVKFINIKKIEFGKSYWNLVKTLCNHYFIFDYGISTDIINPQYLDEVLLTFKPFMDTQHKDQDWISNRDNIVDLCVNILVKSTRTCLENNDSKGQTHTLSCIKSLGMCRNEKLILPVTKLLIYFIMHPQCAPAPKAIVYLREVCEFHELTPNQVYHRYKKDCCKLFVECSLYNGKDFAIFLLKVVRAFGFVGYRNFISKEIHHFLPYLIPYSVTVPQVPSMIEEIAALVQCSVSEFLIERFPHIYVHIYLTESKDTAQKCYSIVERLTETSTLTLISKHFTVILTEFLLQFCFNPREVLKACKYLARHEPNASTPRGSTTASATQVADFLNPKFLGVLAYFDHKLVNAKVALSVKRKALKSFPEIMQLMGAKYLTPLRFKILATLRSALPLAREFPDILAEAWRSFVRNIDATAAGPMLANLAVPLLHQFEYAPNEINSTFQYLVLENENLLGSHISDLFFLEDSNISNDVKIVIKKHAKRSRPDRFRDKIEWYLRHLSHDIPKIKENVFRQLDGLMRNNRNEIHAAIFEGRTIEGVIVELIDALLIGCRSPAAGVSLASARCLGQLGAVEAGLLPRRYVEPDGAPFAFSIDDDRFAATALLELARAFQYEKDTKNMDCYSLTIQEILKIYEISPSGSKKRVWDSFPENIHQIMSPLLGSRYTLAYPSRPKEAHPLFGSMYATGFLEWAHNWVGQLIPLVLPARTRALLCAVQPSMRRDPRTLFLFLPYVVLHAVMSGDAQYIREEILAVIGGEKIDSDSAVSTDRSKYKMLRHIRMTPNINSSQSEEGNQSKCSKTVYTLFDFLNRWLLEWCHVKQKPLENENYKSIKKFMDTFDKLAIARGNYACGELERALQYLEMYMEEDANRIQAQLPFQAKIYALLDEPDSIAGILSIQRSEPSPEELVLAQVVTGRLQDAALCYERLARHGHLDRHSLQGMTECYLSLDQPFTALQLLSGAGGWAGDWTGGGSGGGAGGWAGGGSLAAEPLWRLGRFEQLKELAAADVPPSCENWGLLMGRILLAYRQRDRDSFKLTCDNAMNRLLVQMDGESRGESALKSGYQSVLGLHIIKEVQHVEEVLWSLTALRDGDIRSTEIINTLLGEWRLRLALVQSDVRTVEPLLRIRRILLQQTQDLLRPTHATTAGELTAHIGDLWLQSAKHARKAGIFQQSYMYILNAEEYKPEGLFIEKAKTYWSRGQHEPAFSALRRGLEEAFPGMEGLTLEQRKICAKAKLLIAKYNDETTNVDVVVNIGYYKKSVEAFNKWEKSLVCLGAYYEKVSGNDTDPTTMWSRRLYALNSYGKALQYGHKYLYQSMPRMLSIWLDVDVTGAEANAAVIVTQMTEVIKTYAERLPIYLYFTAFSQIVSRICHPNEEVYLQLKAIIARLVAAYPQPALWMMLCVVQSGSAARRQRCADVLADARLQPPALRRLVRDYRRLADGLVDLCNKPIPGKASTTTVSSLVPTLPRLLSSSDFSHIMMPYEEFCKIVLPSKDSGDTTFNIPTEPAVYITGIQEQVTRLPSLQQPRKVTLMGSNGKSYIIMLKPKDDLRKDFRLMEFNGVVNKFLQDAPETRKRRLYIRTYSVFPLNEECGLIEWVPNLLGLRPILIHIYKQKGIHTSNSELKNNMMCSNQDSVKKKRDVYERLLLPRHPPVFQEWFRRTFTDPYGWYQARSAYIRTTAVMSIVGYILGLGDRHGENVSFDATNGDTVHVDFNCLFNKGEGFEWPERVPFRLTHNMEAAMGPLGHEGMYRKCCEAVSRAVRSRAAALMSVVGPFVYDPLVAWSRRQEPGERTNPQARLHLAHILGRLQGKGRLSLYVLVYFRVAMPIMLLSIKATSCTSFGQQVKNKNTESSVSLSPEGLVEYLIAEATSVENLCQMYIGWGPFL